MERKNKTWGIGRTLNFLQDVIPPNIGLVFLLGISNLHPLSILGGAVLEAVIIRRSLDNNSNISRGVDEK
jgi:hypothetical protein